MVAAERQRPFSQRKKGETPVLQSRKNRTFVLLLMLLLLLCLAGCKETGGELFPWSEPDETTRPVQQTQPQTVVTQPAEPQIPEVPAYSKELAAVQCYYQGQLQREYALTYDEQGRLVMLQIYTYDKGSLYSWGENRYEYDHRGNLTVNDYVYSLGTQRWEYENTYDDQGILTGCQVTEYYHSDVVSKSSLEFFYDAQGRYLGTVKPYDVTFDEYGRFLSVHAPFDYGDIHGESYTEYDYSMAPAVLINSRTVFPEYDQFGASLRVMLNRYHVAFGVDMREGYQTVTDSDGCLTRVTDDSGSDVYVFIYN